ncbi:MAG: MBL fold metallo-hydrolase [Chloroflexi bacterium]|nr:MBL fold metallo-hydrolase [Chloroflexota bacterium]
MTLVFDHITKQITQIDLQYQGRRQVIASYLFFDGNEAALIETGPALTVETLIASVRAAGVPIEILRHLFVTHIHLDHSGAAGVLVQRFPWMRVYVHPVGAPHLADPSRLVTSAARLYGDRMDTVWGLPLPVPSENLVVVNDGDEFQVAGTTLRAFDTPGHARHHHAYLDTTSGLLCTGDVGGVRMPNVCYVRPPTPPPELDLETWKASIARLRALKATGLCPTHFGVFRGDADWHWSDLEQRLIRWGEIIREEIQKGSDDQAMLRRMEQQIVAEFETISADLKAYDVAASYEHIVSGYARYWRKKLG